MIEQRIEQRQRPCGKWVGTKLCGSPSRELMAFSVAMAREMPDVPLETRPAQFVCEGFQHTVTYNIQPALPLETRTLCKTHNVMRPCKRCLDRAINLRLAGAKASGAKVAKRAQATRQALFA